MPVLRWVGLRGGTSSSSSEGAVSSDGLGKETMSVSYEKMYSLSTDRWQWWTSKVCINCSAAEEVAWDFDRMLVRRRSFRVNRPMDVKYSDCFRALGASISSSIIALLLRRFIFFSLVLTTGGGADFALSKRSVRRLRGPRRSESVSSSVTRKSMSVSAN